MIYTCTY